MTGTDETNNLTRQTYLLIGDGRLALHLDYYLKSQNIFLKTWSRKNKTIEQLKELSDKADFVLLAISDSSLKNFLDEHAFLRNKKAVHFSGAETLSGVISLHPLMTFPPEVYSLDFYKKIPFVGIKNRPCLKDVFPTLENPYFEINESDKSKYHSLCVMANNFTTLLWQKVFQDFDEKLSLPKSILMPYLEATLLNLKTNSKVALTGPIARNDTNTLNKNIRALEDDAFQEVYKSFVLSQLPNFKMDPKQEFKNDNP